MIGVNDFTAKLLGTLCIQTQQQELLNTYKSEPASEARGVNSVRGEERDQNYSTETCSSSLPAAWWLFSLPPAPL